MDNTTLNQLLAESGKRQFWIKPWGHPDLPASEGQQIFNSPVITTGFAKKPSGVKIGDILFVYRIKVSKLMFIAEAISPAWEVTNEDIKRIPDLKRWKWNIATRNWTPTFGVHWAECSLHPFSLADEHNELHPQDKVSLGSIQFGGDKRRITKGFAESIIKKILDIPDENTSKGGAASIVWEVVPILGSEETLFFEHLNKSGAGFGNPETNRKVEQAAISHVRGQYESDGWQVVSVESEKRGYDLLCTNGAKSEHVEVKGVQSAIPSFIVTANEVKQARDDTAFVICVVTSALSDAPKLHRFSGRDFINGYNFAPLAYRAIPK